MTSTLNIMRTTQPRPNSYSHVQYANIGVDPRSVWSAHVNRLQPTNHISADLFVESNADTSDVWDWEVNGRGGKKVSPDQLAFKFEPVIESMQAHVVMHLGLVFIWGECGKVIVKATVLDEHNNIAAEDTNPRIDEMVAAFTGLVST